MSRTAARSRGRHLQQLLADHGGFEKRAKLDPSEIATVLELRSKYGVAAKQLLESEKMDQPFYQSATTKLTPG
jgi:hypothetical protein